MSKSAFWILMVSLASGSPAQAPTSSDPAPPAPAARLAPSPSAVQRERIAQAEDRGVEVRIKDIAHFRGVRSNQVSGFGLVIGLEGTGDTKKTPMTQTLLANLFLDYGTQVDPKNMDVRNVALVIVTCELPPFAKPGAKVDVLVSSVGDAKSLQGGTLLQTPLFAAGNRDRAYVVSEGPISIGGFNASSGGNSVQKNHVNVGRIPEGGIVESSVPTRVLFGGNAMYLELDHEDLTTAQRVATEVSKELPEALATALDGATIQLTLPSGANSVGFMSRIEALKVFADVEAKVVINERTGTIVVGGNVRIGPAAVAHGSLNVRIEQEPVISQPAPLSNGQTVQTTQTQVNAGQDTAKVAMVAPNTTVADLARILQALELKPTDIISILQALRQQGALKARIELQ
ncbi:MAG: flagellar basal body P-ring protein FlgI [Fimbriimonas ginsengisoli]|uniref:Flagellar P-ring protein n=1 Tax=Fimbriimonas ginsengisoli TaxID=1005039 RepID=A0A931PSX0_FIMGI|nr:flagellar basal body P-ring protein FlgI [Fimbriimonas ginsengisoli]